MPGVNSDPRRQGWGVRLTGLEGLEKALLALGPSAGRQVMVRTLSKALVPVRDDARSRARRGTEPKEKKRLAESIRISPTLNRNARRRRTPRGVAEVFCGPTVPHGHLIEFGHRLVRGRVRKLTKVVKQVGAGRKSRDGHGGGALQRRVTIGTTGERRVIGHVRAYPFLRPAWDANRSRVLEIVREEVYRELDKVGKRWGLVLTRGAGSKAAARQLARAARETGGGVFTSDAVTGGYSGP